MKNKHTIKKGIRTGIAVLLFLLTAGSIEAQTPQIQNFEQWATTSSTQNSFQRSIVRSRILGGTTYYYVAGATLNSGYYDMMVSKLSASGTVLWTQTYAGAGGKDDVATDVQIDAVGNVYICGSYYKNTTDSNNAVIVKYNSAGTQKWVYTFNGVGSRNDGLSALAVNANTIFAVGTSWVGTTNKYDFLQLKLDSSGNSVWQNTWNYSTANLNDGATNIYSSGGSLWVGGGAQSSTTNYKYALLKIVPATGVISTTSVTGGTAFGVDKLTDLQQDANGNIYVTGGVLNFTTGYDYKTEKFDSTLTLLWSATYTGSGALDDVATGLYIDSLNNVIVTGYTNTTTQRKNYATVKYNSSGTQQWVSTFNGAANGNDSATAIVVKGTDVFVTGMSYNGTSYDYYTIKYNSSGTQQWGISWNSAANKSDIATAIAKDDLGNIIVTGQTNNKASFTTVKYAEKSVITPTDAEALSHSFCFTENRGQLIGTDDKPTDIKFYNKTSGNHQQVYFADAYMTYVFSRLDTAKVSPVDSLFRINMTFYRGLTTNVNSKDLRQDYENFFLAHTPDGCVRMKTYNQLYKPEIYTKIDAIYSSNGSGLKYFYVVKPGGTPSQIEEIYTGQNSLSVNGSGALVISSTLGYIVHPKARVWEIDSIGVTHTLAWQPTYTVSGTHVTFTSLGSYHSTRTLVIEVDNGSNTGIVNQITGTNLEWSTHYGSLCGGDSPFDVVKADKDGNTFWGGSTTGNAFPVANGLQSIPGGNQDWTLVKIRSNAVRRWATYYGGNGTEYSMQMGLDSSANIYFAAVTGSSSATMYMASPQPVGAYVDATANGGNDVFIVKMDSTGGAVQWSTFYGAAGFERPTGIWVNPTGKRILVTGYAGSGFPLVSRTNAYNSTTGQAFIMEFDSLHNTQWVTRFGNTTTSIDDVVGDPDPNSGDFWVVGSNGGTITNLPMIRTNPAAYYDSIATNDAIIARFDMSDTVRWCTAFGGTGADNGSKIILTAKDIYAIGWTSSAASTFPLQYVSGEYCDSIINTNNPDGWIARFSVTGVKKWTSLWGGAGMELLLGLAADDNHFVYVHGISDSPSNNLYATGNSYLQTQSAASQESVILGFAPNNTRTWATCFGGNKSETGTSICAVGHSKIFIAGRSNSLPTTYPWAFPNLVPNEWIDTLKTSITTATGYMARFDISVISVGIFENSTVQNGDFLIYPNPTSGNLTVQLNDLKGEDVTITVVDLLGQVIVYRKNANNFGTLQESIDLSGLSNGVYMVTVQIGNRGTMTKKVIKQQ